MISWLDDKHLCGFETFYPRRSHRQSYNNTGCASTTNIEAYESYSGLYINYASVAIKARPPALKASGSAVALSAAVSSCAALRQPGLTCIEPGARVTGFANCSKSSGFQECVRQALPSLQSGFSRAF